jgi:thermostable 8-oxoguanine DNA glycosylase
MKVLSVERGAFVENGYRFTIRSLNYYLLTENNVENILSNPKIDISDMYLFLWYKNDGTFEYRLAYDVIFE